MEIAKCKCIVQIVKWKLQSGNYTCKLTCKWVYLILDIAYYNVKWQLDGKNLGWFPRRPRFKPSYQKLYFGCMLIIYVFYIHFCISYVDHTIIVYRLYVFKKKNNNNFVNKISTSKTTTCCINDE
jgi:hypothetical protein